MTDTAKTGAKSTPGSQDNFDLVLGKATDTWDAWQQIPAWVLGGAAILGGACLIAFPKHFAADQSRDAWAAVIVALFLAVLLSFRSALTLSEGAPQSGKTDTPPPATTTPKSSTVTAASSPTPANATQTPGSASGSGFGSGSGSGSGDQPNA